MPNIAIVSPAKKYQYSLAMPTRRKEGDVESVKIIGMIGMIIPMPIISRTRVKKRIVSVFRSI